MCMFPQCEINTCWNNRCTKTAGFCKWKKRKHSEPLKIRIELAPRVFFTAITASEGQPLLNSGIVCNNILECLLITYEHELIHALISCFCLPLGRNNTGRGTWTGKTRPGNNHSKTFMSITNNLFGHTQYTHDLFSTVSARQENSDWKERVYHNLKKGDKVIVKDRKKRNF